MTFHAYVRARRLAAALGRITQGSSVLDAAMDGGYDSLSGFNDAFKSLLGEPPSKAKKRRAMTITRVPTQRTFDVPVATPGTEFQQDVWRALAAIPYGETRSYQEVAIAIGRPKAVRAVGKANGDNRLAVLIPCHRVIGAAGALTGYGGGKWRKQRLLDLERDLKNPVA